VKLTLLRFVVAALAALELACLPPFDDFRPVEDPVVFQEACIKSDQYSLQLE
jgi:hypothetical protein